MSTVQFTDEALLLSGDLEDFGRFYDRYVRSLLAFFQRRTRNPEVAADLTAETFAAAMIARGRYEARTATAAAWLFAIAQHKLADYRRRGAAEDRMRARLGMLPVRDGRLDVHSNLRRHRADKEGDPRGLRHADDARARRDAAEHADRDGSSAATSTPTPMPTTRWPPDKWRALRIPSSR
jgi:DNA-directed RNA polymerase specialized sigma24 family protein